MPTVVTRVIQGGKTRTINSGEIACRQAIDNLISILKAHKKTAKDIDKALCPWQMEYPEGSGNIINVCLSDFMPGGKMDGKNLSGWMYTRIANHIGVQHDTIIPKSNTILARFK